MFGPVRMQVPLLAVSVVCAGCDFDLSGLAAPGFIAGEAPMDLRMVVDDPLSDHTGSIDVVSATLRFGTTRGAYEIEIAAAPEAPFRGDFRVNVNLFNVDHGSFFQDTMNEFSLSVPTTKITLTGTSPDLLWWSPGDRVHTNSLAGTPTPQGSTVYRSSVQSYPLDLLTNEDYIAFEDPARSAVVDVAPGFGG